uniref:Uncharacterized protein n=2 Tax=Methanosarcina acetivorans TaxID=2214 RepID=P94913_9EURY|nr:unknown [Methanosarcina acetivorans]AQZ26647.1 orf2 [Cloning vector pDN211]
MKPRLKDGGKYPPTPPNETTQDSPYADSDTVKYQCVLIHINKYQHTQLNNNTHQWRTIHMPTQEYTRTNITLPEHVRAMIKEYNKRSTWGDLNVSAVCSNAIADRIRATFPKLEKELFPEQFPELNPKMTKTSSPGQPEITQKGKSKQGDSKDRICAYCGQPFEPKSHNQKFCKDACKSANYRKNKKTQS